MVTKETRADGISAPAHPVAAAAGWPACLGLARARAKEVEPRVVPEDPPTPQTELCWPLDSSCCVAQSGDYIQDGFEVGG